MTARHQLVGILVIDGFAVALPVRAVVATESDTFIGNKTHPFQGIDDVLFRPRHITALIGIFYPKDKLPALLTGQQVIVQRRANAANVQRAGGGWSKTNADQWLSQLNWLRRAKVWHFFLSRKRNAVLTVFVALYENMSCPNTYSCHFFQIFAAVSAWRYFC